MARHRRICKATTRHGQRCKVTRNLSREGYCLWHDPERVTEAQRARSKGGRHHRRLPDRVPKAPQSLTDVVDYSSWVADQLSLGNLEPKTAREITNALRIFQLAVEKRDMQHEVRELQQQVKQLTRRS